MFSKTAGRGGEGVQVRRGALHCFAFSCLHRYVSHVILCIVLSLLFDCACSLALLIVHIFAVYQLLSCKPHRGLAGYGSTPAERSGAAAALRFVCGQAEGREGKGV